MDNVLAFILGGGAGTRLSPLTKFRAKPAVPLGGKYRLIDIPVSNCINSGLIKICVVTQFNSESLNRSIYQTYKFDIFSKGYIHILSAEQSHGCNDWFQGTADAIRKNIKHIADSQIEYVLILSGDQLYRMDYKKVIQQHIESKADATLALTTTDAKKAPGFGLAKINDQGEILSFVEKPQDEKTIQEYLIPENVQKLFTTNKYKDYVLANMGIYVFSKDYLVKLMEETTETDFGKNIFPSLLGKKKLMSYIHDAYWEDIGTIKAFYEANLSLTAPLPKFNLYDMDYPIYAQPLFLPASKVELSVIRNSMLSDGCIINKSNISNSVVGIRTSIKKNTHIKDSIIMGADYYETNGNGSLNGDSAKPKLGIGQGCIITNSIIDKNVHIGNNVKIINKNNVQDHVGENYIIKDGIVVIEKNTIIPDNTVI